jgi:FKBP-type peptidyl-prolyl cis-trans isomerase
MKKIILPLVSAVALSALIGCGQGERSRSVRGVSVKKNISLTSERDSFSYVIGRDIARSMQMFASELNKSVLLSAIVEGLDTTNESKIDENTSRQIQMSVFSRLREEAEAKAKVEAENNALRNTEFFSTNAAREGVNTTESGLQYEILIAGDAESAKPTTESRVEVRYVGTLLDGKVFDETKDDATVKFPVSGVIRGWTEGLQLMNVGSRFKFFIPSDLAYGERGIPGVIPPASALIFEVELVGIE